MQVGRPEEAIPQFRRATELQPGIVPARNNLGGALAMRGRLQEAETQFRKAVELDPAHALSHFNLGLVLFESGKADAAISQWKKALEINADYTEALKQTAWVLATHPKPSIRNGVDALKFAQRAAQLSAGKDTAILDTLAASYAEAGRFQEAVKTGREALKLRIALYEAKTPCRESPPAPR